MNGTGKEKIECCFQKNNRTFLSSESLEFCKFDLLFPVDTHLFYYSQVRHECREGTQNVKVVTFIGSNIPSYGAGESCPLKRNSRAKKYGGKCSKQNSLTICSVITELTQETQIMQRERDRSRVEEREREREGGGGIQGQELGCSSSPYNYLSF